MTETLAERRDRVLGAGAPLFYDQPVHIVRGEGVWLYGADGTRYLDMYNNVPCVGHCHPHVVEAMHRQASTLNVHSRYLHEGIVDYADRLLKLHAEPLESAVFACSGTEALEVALHIAHGATGKRGIVCSDAAYHGNSAEVSKLTRAGQRNEPGGDVVGMPFPQRYRPLRDGLDDAALTEVYLGALRDAIETLEASGAGLAAFLVCPILANEGLPDIPEGFMGRAADLVRAAGGVVICDEVQAGFCRTGRWWGYEVTDFVPDIVAMGKPMGNGLPLSGVVASRALVEDFRAKRRYFNTFASSPLQAAVGSAVLDVIENERLQDNVAEVGAYLKSELETLAARVAPMGDVRGHGLFIGVEWVSDREAKTPDRDGAVAMANALKDKGILVSNAGALGNVLKLRPPLVYQREHADLFLGAFAEAVAAQYGAI